MQILEAALAFGITMFVLSMISSSFVEIIHRAARMREAGLKHMLNQLFDQVLKRYFTADADGKVPAFGKNLDEVRAAFVAQMSANRAPVPVGDAPAPKSEKTVFQRGTSIFLPGDELKTLTPGEFMERLGSTDFGKVIHDANAAIGATAADKVDAVLKDVAQKFEAFGRESSAFFENRARLLTVLVAIVFAFTIRADAIEIFNTYLRDPNARNTVIEQSKAETAQYEAAIKAAEALKAAAPAQALPEAQVAALKRDLQASMDNTRSKATQYADLGLPIGWTKENATLNPWAWLCKVGGTSRVVSKDDPCIDGQKTEVGWVALRVAASLLLGGILIGLGGPFWYGAVTGLSNIRNVMRDRTDSGAKAPDTARAPAETSDAGPDKPQPITPVGAFKVARAAADASVPKSAVELLRQDPHSGSDHFLARHRGDEDGMTRPSPEGL